MTQCDSDDGNYNKENKGGTRRIGDALRLADSVALFSNVIRQRARKRVVPRIAARLEQRGCADEALMAGPERAVRGWHGA